MMYRATRILKRNPLLVIGIIITLAFVSMPIFAPLITPYKPDAMDYTSILSFPSPAHPFGTDDLGRDILSRVIYGSRIDLGVVAVVISLALGIGLTLGLAAGYLGGWLDNLIMRVVDVFMSIPYIVLAMAVAAALKPGLKSVIIAMSVAWWRGYARLARGEVLSIKEEQYVEAARAIGVNSLRIMFRHIVPNLVIPIVIYATLDMGSAILTLASLSFLGYGVQPPAPEWGAMITAARNYILNQWWLITFPGLAIMLVVLGFNLLGDGLREILDPKMRGY